MNELHAIHALLKGKRFNLQNEKETQKQIGEILSPILHIAPEYRLDANNIIDFMVGQVGVEVKIKGNKMAIYKQCERYCKFESVKALILVTSKAMGFPEQINGKPCYVLNISKAWL